MNSVLVVSTSMLDAATVSRLLTQFGRGFDNLTAPFPRLSPRNALQHAFLSWYEQNWRLPQVARITGLISEDRPLLARSLPHVVLPFAELKPLGDNELGMVTHFDLSGGLSVATEPTRIVAGMKFFKGLRIDAKDVRIYKIPGLKFPLVKVAHSRTLDFWMTIPNQPLEGDLSLYHFATEVMAGKKDLHQVRGTWSHVEVPEVRVMVCRDTDWLRGLGINEYQLGQVVQICDLEISKRRVGMLGFGPNVMSETLEGPPTLSFDQDFVVWATHLSDRLVSPVVHVPMTTWQEVR